MSGIRQWVKRRRYLATLWKSNKNNKTLHTRSARTKQGDHVAIRRLRVQICNVSNHRDRLSQRVLAVRCENIYEKDSSKTDKNKSNSWFNSVVARELSQLLIRKVPTSSRLTKPKNNSIVLEWDWLEKGKKAGAFFLFRICLSQTRRMFPFRVSYIRKRHLGDTSSRTTENEPGLF